MPETPDTTPSPDVTNELDDPFYPIEKKEGFLQRISGLLRKKPEAPFLPEQLSENGGETLLANEKFIIGNVLKLNDMTAEDVMVPRADVVAIDLNASADELLQTIKESQYSRYPVFDKDLDDVIGLIHIKDVLNALTEGKEITIPELIIETPIISPSIPVQDLMLKMRETRKHMMFVVDEFGGIDGIVTLADILEQIVGDISDEHGQSEDPAIIDENNGHIVADARVDVDDFEERYGIFMNDEEREEVDTLGGIAFMMAGRIPARGEILEHPSGLVFEVLDADSRRIYRLRIHKLNRLKRPPQAF